MKHLQKRQLATRYLRAAPQASNSLIAHVAGVDPKTVIAVRRKLETKGIIPQFDHLLSSDGRARPAMAARSRPIGTNEEKQKKPTHLELPPVELWWEYRDCDGWLRRHERRKRFSTVAKIRKRPESSSKRVRFPYKNGNALRIKGIAKCGRRGNAMQPIDI